MFVVAQTVYSSAVPLDDDTIPSTVGLMESRLSIYLVFTAALEKRKSWLHTRRFAVRAF